MRLLPSHCFFVILTILAACQDKSALKSFRAGNYIIRANETVQLEGRSIQVTNKGCGRKWISDNNKPAYERAYCDLVFKSPDSIIISSGTDAPYYLADVMINVDRMNPWGREEDSVPAGGIRIYVQRSPAFIFLEKFNWLPLRTVRSEKMEIPADLAAQPWSQYAAACQQAGFALEKLAGEQVDFVTIILKDKGKRSGVNLVATVLVQDDQARCGWLSTPADTGVVAALNVDREKTLADW